jgi:hypothetical protein
MRTVPLLIGWFATRLLALLSGFSLIPYPWSEYLFSDVRLYDWWAGNIANGFFPINDPMWQYPPLAAVVFLAGYSIAPGTVGFIFLALVADLAIMVLLLVRGRELSNNLPATIWLVTAVAIGPILLGRFDVFPTLAAVFALLYVSSPKNFGSALAIGALLKVWPILLLLATPQKKLARVLLWFAVTFGTGCLLLSIWWDDSFTFLGEQRSRGLQIESVGALPYQLWNAGPASVASALQFGTIEVIAPGTKQISLIVTLIGIALLGRLLFWRIFGRLNSVQPADIALLSILLAIVSSRVLSPQYLVWVFGILAVCAFAPQQNFRLIFILISISAVLGQMLYPGWYVIFQQGSAIAVTAQTIRIVTLIWATVLVWRNLSLAAQQLQQDSPTTGLRQHPKAASPGA